MSTVEPPPSPEPTRRTSLIRRGHASRSQELQLIRTPRASAITTKATGAG